MNQQQDPVVKDLNSWINRSAGQHQRRFSEGSASASRLLHSAQTDEEAANLKQWRANVIASGLHKVDTAHLGKRDGVSLGDCRQQIEYAGDEPVNDDTAPEPLTTVLLACVFLALLLAAFFVSAPELFWMVAGVL